MCYKDQKETRVLLRGNDLPRQFSLSDQVNAPREDSIVKEPVIGHASLVLPYSMDNREPVIGHASPVLPDGMDYREPVIVFHFSDDASEISPCGTGATTCTALDSKWLSLCCISELEDTPMSPANVITNTC